MKSFNEVLMNFSCFTVYFKAYSRLPEYLAKSSRSKINIVFKFGFCSGNYLHVKFLRTKNKGSFLTFSTGILTWILVSIILYFTCQYIGRPRFFSRILNPKNKIKSGFMDLVPGISWNGGGVLEIVI